LFETQAELDMKRKLLLSRGLPPIYDREGLNLTNEQIQQYIAQGKKPHYRFLLNEGTIKWDDLIRGPIHFEAKNLSDPIVIREDGSMTYILCSAIDDIDFNITHVLRGEDHITNTAIGIQIIEALESNPPKLGHISLLKSKVEKISKRLGGFDIKSLRDTCIHPMAIKSLLAKMGTSDPISVFENIDELVDSFAIEKFGLAAVNYDYDELVQLNHKLVSSMSFEAIKPSLVENNIIVNESFWNSIRHNLNKIDEIRDWLSICNDKIIPVIAGENREFLELAVSSLPDGEWDNSTWNTWINSLKEQTQRSGKLLFMPIRLALTGKEDGPELKLMLPLIGKEKVIKRLKGEHA
jgi:glutamyl-tRNA synthetase